MHVSKIDANAGMSWAEQCWHVPGRAQNSTAAIYIGSCAGDMFSGGPNSVIVQAFKWAAAVNPSVRLCLNDYGLIDSDRCEYCC